MKVALIQDRPIFGGNASQEIRVHTLGIHGYGSDILKTIDTAHWPNGHFKAKDDQQKREKTMAESGVDLFPHHTACGLEKEGDKILSVEAREVKHGKLKGFVPQFLLMQPEMVGLDTGPVRTTDMVVKPHPSTMKGGISLEIFGARRRGQPGDGDECFVEQRAYQNQTGFPQCSMGYAGCRRSCCCQR